MRNEETLRPVHGRSVPDRDAPGGDRAPIPARQEAEPAVRALVRILLDARWLLAGVIAAFLLLGGAYVFLKTPVYESNTVVQVEDPSRGATRLQGIAAIIAEPPPSDTEMALIRSRTVLEGVADELRLDLEVRPARFPVVGAAVARRHREPWLASPPLGLPALGPWAWGGERIRLERLEVSDALFGKPLRLVVGEDGGFRVEREGQVLVEDARPGRPFAGSLGDARVGGYVAELIARPGTAFEVVRRRRNDVVEALARDLEVSERGKKTGILVVSLEGADPQRIARILRSLANAYVRLNVERRSAEAAKTLAFLESQLPELKSTLAAAESAASELQRERGVVDLSKETQALLDRSVELEKELSQVELERSELAQRFMPQHPSMAAMNEKVKKLRAERAAMNARMRQLPETELDSARLARDVKVSSELYMLVLNKAQELRVLKSGTVGNVRTVDDAFVPDEPVAPRPGPVLFVSLLLGLGAGVGLALLRTALDDRTMDPDEIERVTGVPVYATIPHSPRQARLAGGAWRRRPLPILAADDPSDLAIEHLRSLRTSLQFALLEATSKVVMVSGPSPGLGKSFVAVNLSRVLADTDCRVLLVDADLRRGHLHRYFGLPRSPGLSELLTGSAEETAIRKTDHPRLDVLATGRVPPNPAEMLASERFRRLVADVSSRYDMVLVDTSPILAVTDPALVGRVAGVVLLVLKAGKHPVREIDLAVKRLEQNRIKVHGAVLNDVTVSGLAARYAGHYQYEYRSLRAE
jgi:tyrosine-protein kinase Etk/Wzc